MGESFNARDYKWEGEKSDYWTAITKTSETTMEKEDL